MEANYIGQPLPQCQGHGTLHQQAHHASLSLPARSIRHTCAVVEQKKKCRPTNRKGTYKNNSKVRATGVNRSPGKNPFLWVSTLHHRIQRKETS